MDFVLTPEQLILLQWIAQGITQGIKIIWVKLLKQPKPKDGHVLLLVFVVSTGLAYFWGDVELPPIGDDPMKFALDLLTAALSIFTVASVIYERLSGLVLGWLDKVLSKITGRAVSLLRP